MKVVRINSIQWASERGEKQLCTIFSSKGACPESPSQLILGTGWGRGVRARSSFPPQCASTYKILRSLYQGVCIGGEGVPLRGACKFLVYIHYGHYSLYCENAVSRLLLNIYFLINSINTNCQALSSRLIEEKKSMASEICVQMREAHKLTLKYDTCLEAERSSVLQKTQRRASEPDSTMGSVCAHARVCVCVCEIPDLNLGE